MSMTSLEARNIAAGEHKANPHPFYARLRAEHPVFPMTLPDKRTIWLVTRYDDVATVLKDERFIKNLANAPRNKGSQQPYKRAPSNLIRALSNLIRLLATL